MAVFKYRAIDVNSSELTGTVIASTPRQARDELRGRGLTVTHVSVNPVKVKEQAKKIFYLIRRSRRGQAEVIAFIRDLETLLGAGIPLLSALHTLSNQYRRRFRAIVQQLVDDIAAGQSLAEAMGRQDEIFDELCVSIIQVGETTGSLEAALGRLADYKEKTHQLHSRVTTVLLYPAVVCTIGLAVMVFLMTYVVPNLLDTLSQTGKPLPAVTQVIMTVSDLLRGWWWAILTGVVVMAIAFKAVVCTERGRRVVDCNVLRIPVLGELVRKENTSRMAVVLAALLRSGLNFVEAVRITRRTLRNDVFRKAMDDYEVAVSAGSDVAKSLAATGVFRPMVVQMLAVGQQSGHLEEMLEKLAAAYDQQIDIATQRLTALLEPVLIMILAVLVGFIAFATILPILEASNVL